MDKTGKAEAALNRMMDSPRFGEGARLPPERVLSEELGISRGTLRRVFERLEAKGKIWRHVGRGTFVGRRPATTDAKISVVSEKTSPHELMEMRLILEPQIAKFAAMRATHQQIIHMRYCVKKTGSVTDSEAYELWDAMLHRAVAEAAHNSLLLVVFDAFNEVRNMTEWGRLRDIVVSSRAVQLCWWRQHEAFVEAIANRDPERAEEMARRHVEKVSSQMFDASKGLFADNRGIRGASTTPPRYSYRVR
jgi:DNA-binding FadR family transcriptional regulator